MDFDNIENIAGFCLIILCFFGGGIFFIFVGLREIGIIKYRGINKRKWTKTTAKIGNSKYIKERPIGKSSKQFIYYLETEIEYEADGVEYKKYIRNLPKGYGTTCIYYKNNNPNYIKLMSDIRNNRYTNKPLGIFLSIIGIILAVSGCLILSGLF